MPDTGATVSFMSAAFATSRNFKVDTDPQHCLLLELATGMKTSTTGLVRDMAWKYAGSDASHPVDVYILPELPVDLVLGDEFLDDTDAFVAHQADFWSADEVVHCSGADANSISRSFFILKVVSANRWRKWGLRKSSPHAIDK
jgi:hypothetical protein